MIHVIYSYVGRKLEMNVQGEKREGVRKKEKMASKQCRDIYYEDLGKNEKRERKLEENYIKKNEGKGLKKWFFFGYKLIKNQK